MSELLLTLRHNIVVEADVQLALEELVALSGQPAERFSRLLSVADVVEWLNRRLGPNSAESKFILRHLRDSGTRALVLADAPATIFELILRNAAFVQEALLLGSCVAHSDSPLLKKLARQRFSKDKPVSIGVPLAAMLDYSAPLVFKRDRIISVNTALDAIAANLLDGKAASGNISVRVLDAVDARKTTLYLSHELHLYKGKFFPRLVHSLINRYTEPGRQARIADPFVGSGTTLLEAALLGHSSIGLDIDPISALISEHKLTLASVDPAEIGSICDAIQIAAEGEQSGLFSKGISLKGWKRYRIEVPEPMQYRLRKRGSEEGYNLLGEIENDSAKALCLISQLPPNYRSLFRVCLSHALTKKIRLRFVGIGNGRFTFDVAKVGVLELFLKKAYHMVGIAEGFTWVRSCGIELGNAEVARQSAANITSVCGRKAVDLIITSPPYIPASSGREHYARARAIPLVLTGAATVAELEELDEAFIGEMSASSSKDHIEGEMPPNVQRTLAFLSNDEQRLRKYIPTLQYYRDIRDILSRTNATLRNGGTALFVVAKSHTFYIHKTKQVLHTVQADTALCELGEQVGLTVEHVIDVPLQKSGGLNARPRSTDEYAEAVVVFKAGPQARSSSRGVERTSGARKRKTSLTSS